MLPLLVLPVLVLGDGANRAERLLLVLLPFRVGVVYMLPLREPLLGHNSKGSVPKGAAVRFTGQPCGAAHGGRGGVGLKESDTTVLQAPGLGVRCTQLVLLVLVCGAVGPRLWSMLELGRPSEMRETKERKGRRRKSVQ